MSGPVAGLLAFSIADMADDGGKRQRFQKLGAGFILFFTRRKLDITLDIDSQRARLCAGGKPEAQVIDNTTLDASTAENAFVLINGNIIGKSFKQIVSHGYAPYVPFLIIAGINEIQPDGVPETYLDIEW
jgi:hypothetical protein